MKLKNKETNFDSTNILNTNIYIFKENLKLIINKTSIIKSRSNLERF